MSRSERDYRREFYEWIINRTVTSFLYSYCSEIKEINENQIVAIYVLRREPNNDPQDYYYDVKIVTTNGIIEAVIRKDKIFAIHKFLTLVVNQFGLQTQEFLIPIQCR